MLASEEELTGSSLAGMVRGLLRDSGKLAAMQEAARRLSIDDAATQICDALVPEEGRM